LFLDGARLGSALCAKTNDLTLPELSSLTDVFYIGGTKNGALLGEAIVINNNDLKPDFAYHLKQRGALLAKGRILGIQFMELFKTNLYFELSQKANMMAITLAEAISNLGYLFQFTPTSNQIFPIFPNNVIIQLKKDFDFHVWQKIDDTKSSIRLVTSWSTELYQINDFINTITKL